MGSPDEKIEHIKAILPFARRECALHGSLHGGWDVVTDAEQFVRGKETLLSMPSYEMSDYLIEGLEPLAIKQGWETEK